EELLVAERAHHLDLVLRHRALGVVGVVGQAVRFLAVAVAAQVGGDHGEALRELGRDLVPDRVRLGVAVQQQERRADPALHEVDRSAARPDAALPESREKAVHERNSLPWRVSGPERPGTSPSAISLRGRLFRSTASARERSGTISYPWLFQPASIASNAPASFPPSSSACSVYTWPVAGA